MGKIICDICGTTYPDTADSCPICGCSKDSAMDFLGEDFQEEDFSQEVPVRKPRPTGKKRKEIFDYDEVNPQLDDSRTVEESLPEDEDLEVYEDQPQSNTFTIVVLTVLIAGLLLAAGFLFFRYIRPNLGEKTPTTAPVIQTQATEETVSGIPCQNIALVSGAANLTKEGQMHLINVSIYPENTTDTLTYASADESVATVNENGQITAVGEGETIIYITCGDVETTCSVVVSFQEETVPPTAAQTEATAPEENEDDAADEGSGEEKEETAATEESKDPAIREDVTLKLKKSDIKLGVYYEFRLELDCDLKPEEVEWSVEHPHICSVDETGLVKALKSGVTDVIAKYGDQEVRCKVRCG